MPSTITLAQSERYVRRFVHRAPQTFAGDPDPLFSNADWVRQFLLSPPFRWRWNRSETAFFLTSGVQDYTLTNWAANKQVSKGWIYIDPSGSQQQVTTAGTTGANPPAWGTGQTTDNTVVWTNMGNVGVTTPLANFGWLEKATVSSNDASGTANGVTELTIQLNLSRDSNIDKPAMIAPQFDDGDGNITFRFQPVPDQDYTAVLEFQFAAPTFTDLNGFWNPIPDYCSYLFKQGLLAKTYEASDDPRYLPAMQLFVKQSIGAAGGLEGSQKNIFLSLFLDAQRTMQGGVAEDQADRQGRNLS